ncbi:MAG: lycopene cyclase domain-containing protein [Deferribacteres bacterium]|nr:lycopene cyclase domain-containing protein [candidate division KSB1 bacterium]MCB9504075.1 lycopene cyclase domain-containing protein [Deferribacteres bacterium]
MKLTYLLINVFTIAIPLAFSFHKKLQFHRTWIAFWPATLFTAAIFIIWDIIFTNLGIWGFNRDYLTGIQLLNLPLEEWLFFICIPYAIVFTYAALKKIVRVDYFQGQAKSLNWVLSLLLFALASTHTNQLYTAVTFFATALFLLWHIFYLQADYMKGFYLSYLLIFLGPFLIVNGILTGSFIDEPVVWYNNSENFSIRVLTIPIEDFVYGFLLYLMNVTLYESYLSKQKGESL